MDFKRLACGLEIHALQDDGTFEGYGATFGNVDQGGDIVLPGAFTKSLTVRPAPKVKMLWQHDPSQPIGRWTAMSEDSKGLACKGQIIRDVPKGAEAYALMKAGAVDGLSIGYRTDDSEFDAAANVRKLKTLDLHEISVVTFPMNDQATISNVKATDEKLDRIIGMLRRRAMSEFNPRDVEDGLREAGFSRRDAEKAVAILRKLYRRGEPAGRAKSDEGEPASAGDVAAMLAALAKAEQTLRP